MLSRFHIEFLHIPDDLILLDCPGPRCPKKARGGIGLFPLDLAAAPSKQFAKVEMEFFNFGNQVVIRLMTPLDMDYEESYAKAFPFDKMVPGMLDPEMIEDTAKIVNEAVNDRAQVNLIINNRAGGNAPPIAEKIADRLHKEKQQRLF